MIPPLRTGQKDHMPGYDTRLGGSCPVFGPNANENRSLANSPQKLLHQRNDSLVGVFDDPVAGVRDFVYFGGREELEKASQEPRREAPIAHAPDQLDRPIGERRQAALDFDELRITRMVGAH